MLNKTLKFELKYHFSQLSFLITALLFLVLGCFSAAVGGFGGSEVHRNSPYVITNIVALFSLFSIFAAIVFSANVVLRDSAFRMESIIFTTSIKRSTYFTVRFLGLLTAVFLLLVFAVLGIFLGALFVKNEELGANQLSNFIQPLLSFALPNVFFATSFIYCTTLLTKNARAIYTTGVLLYILYMVASVLGNSPLLATSQKISDPGILPFLIDPFGLASFFSETRQWTDVQRNQQLFPVEGAFLINRIIWSSVSGLLILISYRFFNFRLINQQPLKQKQKRQLKTPIVPFKPIAVFANGLSYNYASFLSQFKIEVASLFKHIPFAVMLLLWTFFFAMELKDSLKGPYGIDFYPTTGLMVEEMRSLKIALILIIFYAAELVGREKATNFQALIYSTPVRDGVMYGAKCLTLMVLVVILVTLNIGIGIGVQLSHGYFQIEWLSYISLYYYSAFPIFLFVILILFVQNLATNKYVGMLLSMFVVFSILFATRFGISHYLLRFATVPDLQFSDFNGFGYYTSAFNWLMLYWASFAGILGVLTIGIWQGHEHAFLDRLRSMPKAIGSTKFVLPIVIVIWICCGSFIYNQTNVVAVYKNKQARLDWQINYEKKYKPLANLPQPTVKSINTEVDLFPNERKYRVKGKYILKNETDRSISKLWIGFDESVYQFKVDVSSAKKLPVDVVYNQQFIELKTPLAPGKELVMNFSFEVIRSGFVDFDAENSIVSNGSYIEMEKFVPYFGYNPDIEVSDKSTRKQNGLPPLIYQASTDVNYHLIDLKTIISVPSDQYVVTVGALKRSWVKEDRRYFDYQTDAPINFMFALSAAKYSVKKEIYKGIELNLYTGAGHQYNLVSIFDAIKDALDYGTENFATYPNKQFTLAEIPQYRGAATAYPGVVFSAERINFLSNYTDKNKIDQSYAVTAHEIAHQWWANKLVPNYGPGDAMLTESLAKYTEFMLMEKKFGKMYLRNYLKADNNLYFVYRNPNEKELPLVKTVDQNHVHYQKGGLAFYAIKELIGEELLNQTLKQFVEKHAQLKQKAKPEDLVAALTQVVPTSENTFLNDSFKEVVTYQMAVRVLSYKAIENGKFRVDLEVEMGKHKQNENQLLLPDLTVDVALFGSNQDQWDRNIKPIYLKKHRFTQFKTQLTIITNQKPKTAAIDPYVYLLDGNLEDNVAVLSPP